jgi:hypothetical protein
MKVNELRIGNIVSHDDYSEETFKVISIKLEDEGYVIDTKGGKNGTWVNHIDLIKEVPITKEWLLKFDFWHNEETNIYYWGEYLQIGFDIDRLTFYHYRKDFSLKYYTKKIKYVHELQNLCYNIEGKLLQESKTKETTELPF